MRRLIAYTVAAILALMFIGCGSDGDNQAIETPGEYVESSDTMPEFWGDVDCDSNYTITSSGVIVHSTSTGFVWPGLVQNGVLRKWGPGKPVDAGVTTVPALQIYLRHDEIPEGNYEFMVYLTQDTSGIGVISSRTTEVLMDHYTLLYPDSAIVCIDAVLGDSLYFHVDYEWETYVITLSDAPPEDYQGAKWWALRGRVRDSLAEDTLWLAKLDTNGLFFPLKVTDPDSGYTWTIRAVNRYNTEDTAEAEVRVSRPTWLGYDNNTYDTVIAWWANKQGVPVSLLKALVHKESGAEFDTAAYRYEPLYDLNRPGFSGEWFS